MNNPTLKKLQEKKERLKKKLSHLDIEYKTGRLEKKEYFNRKFELLDGRFEEDIFKDIDEKIKHEKTKMLAMGAAVTALLALLILAPGNMGGITGFLTFEDGQSTNTMQIGETYDADTVKNLTFLNVSSVQASGKIYGHGEVWIYLRNGDTRRLVHYADTRSSGNSLTGMIIGGTPVNITELNNSGNSSETVNSTVNTSTNAATNNSMNWTVNGTANETNSTNSTANETEPEPVTFEPEIILEKNTYSLGENITIQVIPTDSTYRLYLFAPSEEYILNGDYWVTNEPGNHTLSGFITKGNKTERASTDFYVRSATEVETGSFADACVETCSMADQVPLMLEIVVKNASVELDNITYTGNSADSNETEGVQETGTIVKTIDPPKPADPREEMRKCLAKNPNQRPRTCFNNTQWDDSFPAKNFTLVNSLGSTMAIVDRYGNMIIKGGLIENSNAEPQPYDFVVKKNENEAAAWIDALTYDLHLKGSLVENQDTLMWESRQDYVISNEKGMYLAVFKADSGDLLLRGELR